MFVHLLNAPSLQPNLTTPERQATKFPTTPPPPPSPISKQNKKKKNQIKKYIGQPPALLTSHEGGV